MLATLEEITQRIIQQYSPERIILFGSYNLTTADRAGDIDLFIIKDTEKTPIERRIEVEKILCDRSLPLDIVVYSPAEVRYLFSIGSPFIEEVLEKGRLLYMRKATAGWLKDTGEELETAVILQEHQKHRGACFHSQQCLEKGLKALILERGKRPERTHDILELLNKVKELEWRLEFPVDDAIFLNSVYRGRYPTDEGLLPQGEPSAEDAQKAVAISKTFVELLKGLLR